MYGKKMMQAATVALCLVSLNVVAAQDFSAPGMQELTQLKPNEMDEEDRNAYQDEMQKPAAASKCSEDVAWGRGNDHQPYIAAHLEYLSSSWPGKH